MLNAASLSGGGLDVPDQPCPGAGVHRRDPGAQLRDIAASAGITERGAHGLLISLAAARYVARPRDGRRNC